MNFTQVISELRQTYGQLGTTIQGLATLYGGTPGRTITRMTTGRKRRATATTEQDVGITPTPHKRTLSVAGRKAIARAQKARWAKAKASKLEMVRPQKKAA